MFFRKTVEDITASCSFQARKSKGISAYLRSVFGFALRYRNWTEVARLYWNNKHIHHLMPRLGGELFFPNGSRPLVLMNEVWWKDEYEIGNVNVKPGDTVVDIGANVGVFTWNVLQRFPNIFVYAVEPHPTNFEFLKRNLSSYSRAARVRRLAISRINGEIEMYSPEWLDGVRTRSDHSPPGNERWRNHGCVASCPLSLFLERNELYRVALLKIDIEGAESDLLLEFQADVFATIDRIVMETHEFNHPGLTNEFENLFISKGYDVQRKKIADDRFILLMAQ